MSDLNLSKGLINQLILFFLVALVSLLESLVTLWSITKKGILKKQVLSAKSDLGFDISIKMK